MTGKDIQSDAGISDANDVRFRDFAEAGSDWFFELDAELRFTYVSAGQSEVVGVTPARVIGKTLWDAHAHHRLPEEDVNWQAHIGTLKTHESWKDFTYTIIRDDGQRRVIRSSAKAIFDADGVFRGYRGVGRDVTNQVGTDARLQAILKTVPDAIITIDEMGLINSFSPAAEQIFGYSADEVIGANVRMLMPPPYQEEHDGYVEHYRITGEKKIIGRGRDVEALRKDGSVFPIRLAVNEMNIEGRRMFTGVVHDISALEQARTTSNRLERILDQLINEIYMFDADTLLFTQVNSGARRNLGYSSEEMFALTPVDLKPEFTIEQFEELIKPLRTKSNELLVFKTVHQRKDGTTYPIEVHLQLMRTENPPVFAAIIQDITETERRDALLRQVQKMEAVGQLTGGIAHDFNNLLTVILGNSELIQMQLGDEHPAKTLLVDAIEAAEHGAELTNQLLAFARQQPLSPKVIDLNEIVLKMMDLLRRTLGETVRLNTVLSTSLGKTLADPVQVHNALLNLAINARDAMPKGGDLVIETSNVELDAVSAARLFEAEPGAYVRLTVRDTGAGMSPEVQNQAFDPFFTTKETGKGTGLGLSMVHGFAKQSNGHIDLYSDPGQGTSISLFLPEVRESAETQRQSQDSTTADSKVCETILVVEDDPRVRKVTVSRLEHLGYEVVTTENAREALDYVSQHAASIDLVFTDVVMPGGMSGVELARDIVATYPKIKVVLTSGHAKDGTIDNAALPWLRKPFNLTELAETLRASLDAN